ncbi:MAG: GyrI-like domain-containing protein [Candidatus Thiodiazotropha sp. 6PLUC4]
MKQSTTDSYRQRVIRVIEYIHNHLDEDLTVTVLADVAFMSPYHFHRIYRKLARETLNATIRRLRLQRAAVELITSTKPLVRIATHASYSSPEAFSRAFILQFVESPTEYRSARHDRTGRIDEPFVAMLPMEIEEYRDMYSVEILEVDSSSIIGYPHQGDYMDIGRTFEKIFVYASSHNLLSEKTRSIGLYYDDPKTVEKKKLRSFAAISVPDGVEVPVNGETPHNNEIPGGICASLLFKGSYAELEKPYDWLFGHWLLQSGYEASDFPPFEEYLNDPKNKPPNELLTRINCFVSKR